MHKIFTVTLSILWVASIATAGAAPLMTDHGRPDVPARRAGIVLVAQGCGNGLHRGSYGECVQTARTRPGPYGECPRGFHLGNPGHWCWANF